MEKICHNCSTAISTPFCPRCGQDAHVGRLNMHSLLHEIWHGFTHTDKGILKLIKDLALKPARVYNAYFAGARKTYFSPVVFFLLSFGIYIFLDQKVFDYEDYVVHKYNEYGRLYHLQLKYIALVLLPIQALLSWALFFRKRNLAECIVFWLYCIGFVNVLLILMTPLRLLLITNKHIVDFCLEMLTLLIIVVHAWKVFGTSWRNKILVLLLVFVLQIINVYVSFWFNIHKGIPVHYPSLPGAVQEIFWLLKSK
ncbi:DUF3667 domain-containing protein [Paraflavitalea soli]|uniref:DUF3667 domain-containing protein n=1 Tax=Paraflavitalea soli TaxID=2315862 RepID=A0A3B7MID7_9BACT|nr:DUF3667 domain-containing protein [Paraflavitalea soli]AXY72940.1 DUF3667 domain-containing protein [Paraflavitalea soli]